MMKKGLVKKGDGKDVHHVGGNALKKHSKLKVVSASKNRSYARTKNLERRTRSHNANVHCQFTLDRCMGAKRIFKRS